jgi:hypothetical protein
VCRTVGVAGVLLRREALAGLQAVATRRDPRTGSDFFTQQQEVRNLPDCLARVFLVLSYIIDLYLQRESLSGKAWRRGAAVR